MPKEPADKTEKDSPPMTPTPPPRKPVRSAKTMRFVQLHVRLLSSAILGVLMFAGLALVGQPERFATRFLVAWNIAAFCYIVSVLWLVEHCDLKRLRDRAAEEDEGAVLILVLTVAAAAVSVVAIFVELGAAHGSNSSWRSPLLALSTVVLSWFLIQAIFGIHYAHEFYGEAEGGRKGGLKFPGDGRNEEEEHPEYWDFLYFSFVLGMTFQVSDVQVTSKSLRRVVLGHGVVSFFYSVAVLALMVNLGSDFIKG